MRLDADVASGRGGKPRQQKEAAVERLHRGAGDGARERRDAEKVLPVDGQAHTIRGPPFPEQQDVAELVMIGLHDAQ
jgi:hypothetical protein